MKLTSAQVKNLMRRGLRFFVDPEPEPEQRSLVWEYFGDRCAYCDKVLIRPDGDIDHLVSAAFGGTNGLANRVLSCKPCNAQEKRDFDWEEFLNRKCPNTEILEKRHQKIKNRITMNGGHSVLENELLVLIKNEAERTTAEYDHACRLIREKYRVQKLQLKTDGA